MSTHLAAPEHDEKPAANDWKQQYLENKGSRNVRFALAASAMPIKFLHRQFLTVFAWYPSEAGKNALFEY